MLEKELKQIKLNGTQNFGQRFGPEISLNSVI